MVLQSNKSSKSNKVIATHASLQEADLVIERAMTISSQGGVIYD